MPVAHVVLAVSHVQAAATFYLAALKPLGYRFLEHREGEIGLGVDEPDFWICPSNPGYPPSPTHVALAADSRANVRLFYAAALNNGAQPHANPAFRNCDTEFNAAIVDADGNTVEVVYSDTRRRRPSLPAAPVPPTVPTAPIAPTAPGSGFSLPAAPYPPDSSMNSSVSSYTYRSPARLIPPPSGSAIVTTAGPADYSTALASFSHSSDPEEAWVSANSIADSCAIEQGLINSARRRSSALAGPADYSTAVGPLDQTVALQRAWASANSIADTNPTEYSPSTRRRPSAPSTSGDYATAIASFDQSAALQRGWESTNSLAETSFDQGHPHAHASTSRTLVRATLTRSSTTSAVPTHPPSSRSIVTAPVPPSGPNSMSLPSVMAAASSFMGMRAPSSDPCPRAPPHPSAQPANATTPKAESGDSKGLVGTLLGAAAGAAITYAIVKSNDTNRRREAEWQDFLQQNREIQTQTNQLHAHTNQMLAAAQSGQVQACASCGASAATPGSSPSHNPLGTQHCHPQLVGSAPAGQGMIIGSGPTSGVGSAFYNCQHVPSSVSGGQSSAHHHQMRMIEPAGPASIPPSPSPVSDPQAQNGTSYLGSQTYVQSSAKGPAPPYASVETVYMSSDNLPATIGRRGSHPGSHVSMNSHLISVHPSMQNGGAPTAHQGVHHTSRQSFHGNSTTVYSSSRHSQSQSTLPSEVTRVPSHLSAAKTKAASSGRLSRADSVHQSSSPRSAHPYRTERHAALPGAPVQEADYLLPPESESEPESENDSVAPSDSISNVGSRHSTLVSRRSKTRTSRHGSESESSSYHSRRGESRKSTRSGGGPPSRSSRTRGGVGNGEDLLVVELDDLPEENEEDLAAEEGGRRDHGHRHGHSHVSSKSRSRAEKSSSRSVAKSSTKSTTRGSSKSESDDRSETRSGHRSHVPHASHTSRKSKSHAAEPSTVPALATGPESGATNTGGGGILSSLSLSFFGKKKTSDEGDQGGEDDKTVRGSVVEGGHDSHGGATTSSATRKTAGTKSSHPSSKVSKSRSKLPTSYDRSDSSSDTELHVRALPDDYPVGKSRGDEKPRKAKSSAGTAPHPHRHSSSAKANLDDPTSYSTVSAKKLGRLNETAAPGSFGASSVAKWRDMLPEDREMDVLREVVRTRMRIK